MAARVIGGRYELLHEIGRGGMGTVYAGRDARSGRACAIKVIREEAALSSDARDRFEREARAPGRIGHPGLVEVYDAFAEEDGRMVLVMELLEGVSLREVLGSDAGWVRDVPGVHTVDVDGATAVLELTGETPGADQILLRDALARGEVKEFARIIAPLSEIYREVTA